MTIDYYVSTTKQLILHLRVGILHFTRLILQLTKGILYFTSIILHNTRIQVFTVSTQLKKLYWCHLLWQMTRFCWC